jgi:hypothetical protein
MFQKLFTKKLILAFIVGVAVGGFVVGYDVFRSEPKRSAGESWRDCYINYLIKLGAPIQTDAASRVVEDYCKQVVSERTEEEAAVDRILRGD